MSIKTVETKTEFIEAKRQISKIVRVLEKRSLKDEEHEELYDLYMNQARRAVECTRNSSMAKMYYQLASVVYSIRYNYFKKTHPDGFIPETYPFECSDHALEYLKSCKDTWCYKAAEQFIQKRLASLRSLRKIKQEELDKVSKPSEETKRLRKTVAEQQKLLDGRDEDEKTLDSTLSDFMKALKLSEEQDVQRIDSENARKEAIRLQKDVLNLEADIEVWDAQDTALERFKNKAISAAEKQAKADHQVWLHEETKRCANTYELTLLKKRGEDKIAADLKNARMSKDIEFGQGRFSPAHVISLDDGSYPGTASCPPSSYIQASRYMKQGQTQEISPMFWTTIDSTICCACGCAMPSEKVVCQDKCKGANCGWYCSESCMKQNADVHKFICQDDVFKIHVELSHQGVHQQGHFDALAFTLYYYVLAWARAKHLFCLADEPTLRKVIQRGHQDALEAKESSNDISQYMLETQYNRGCEIVGLNALDPLNDFWIHAGLILGLRKYAIPTYSNYKKMTELSMEEGDTRDGLTRSNMTGIGLYASIVLADVCCLPNIVVDTGAPNGKGVKVQLRALKEMQTGTRYSISFCNQERLDVTERALALEFRKVKCDCAVCRIQKTVFTDRQVQARIMLQALLDAEQNKKDPNEEKAQEQEEEKKMKEEDSADDKMPHVGQDPDHNRNRELSEMSEEY